ncbi:hypothetical protein, partial [Streptomyces sp. NPDC006334]|uniref:hypothetical protein n=1 Tax=Streptomyces sp. NPDC006334 TaxID=3156754 RepID=UPI0033B1979A
HRDLNTVTPLQFPATFPDLCGRDDDPPVAENHPHDSVTPTERQTALSAGSLDLSPSPSLGSA